MLCTHTKGDWHTVASSSTRAPNSKVSVPHGLAWSKKTLLYTVITEFEPLLLMLATLAASIESHQNEHEGHFLSSASNHRRYHHGTPSRHHFLHPSISCATSLTRIALVRRLVHGRRTGKRRLPIEHLYISSAETDRC